MRILRYYILRTSVFFLLNLFNGFSSLIIVKSIYVHVLYLLLYTLFKLVVIINVNIEVSHSCFQYVYFYRTIILLYILSRFIPLCLPENK